MSAPPPLDPFSTTVLLSPANLESNSPSVWHGFHLDENLTSSVFQLPGVDDKSLPELRLGAFQLNLEDVALASLDTFIPSISSIAGDDSATEERRSPLQELKEEEDIWRLPEVVDLQNDNRLATWDHFLNPCHVEQSTPYLSEAGNRTFDAVLQATSKARPAPTVVATNAFLEALWELGLGRSSTYFEWDSKNQMFSQRIEDITLSGCSRDTVQNVIDSMRSAGTRLQTLSVSFEFSGRTSTRISPGRIAFNAAASSSMAAVRQHLHDQKPDTLSLVRLQYAFTSSSILLEILGHLADITRNARNDRYLLSQLREAVRDLTQVHSRYEPVLHEIMSAVAVPVLGCLGVGIGLMDGLLSAHSDVENDETDSWHLLLSSDVSDRVDEASQTLRLGHSWDAIIRLQAQARDYEQSLKESLLLSKTSVDGPFRADKSKLQRRISSLTESRDCPQGANIVDFGSLIVETRLDRLTRDDTVRDKTLGCLQDVAPLMSSFNVLSDQVVDLSVSPLLWAQHRLLSYSLFSLLFQDHKLPAHLQLLRHFHLFGDGTFAARLSTVLFDSDQSSGDGGRRTGASTGLRLQARDTWPPASSELRLVLMGILSDSVTKHGILDDTVSFAIRDLSDDELEKCRDADSIYALDFLQIHYKPPNLILGAVLTPESLEKYDKIFKHALRILRIQGAAQALLRDACHKRMGRANTAEQRFRIEMNHFVSTLAEYSQHDAIGLPWGKFESSVMQISERLQDGDYHGTLKNGKGLDHLRQLQNNTLDAILRGLLLKRKQTEARIEMEDIFGIILRFAASVRRAKNADGDDSIATTRRYHEEFKAHVRKLLGLLRKAAHDAEGYTGRRGVDETTVFEHLLVRLDMFGYWSRK